MLSRLDVSTQRQTATKRMVLCCGCAGLAFVAIVCFGLLPKTHAADKILSNHQVQAAATKILPRLVASYGKLPLSFEANQGQTDARVRFLARGGGYTIFLTDDEAVLTLKKSSVVSGQLSVAPPGTRPGMSNWGVRGLPGRLGPFGPVGSHAGRWPSLADQMKSLWPSLLPDLSQMVPDPNADKGALAAELESQPSQTVRMKLVGSNTQARVVGLNELPGRSNYFIGNDPKKWRTNVPSYAQVKYKGVYPGVDLVYYGNQRQLEYDFVVAPGADPNQIKLSFAGADGMRVDAASGDLVLKVGNDEVRFRKPAVYQPAVAAMSSSTSKPVAALSERRRRSETAATTELAGSFVLASNNQVAFRVGGYDPKRALVIDPVLSYATYLGGPNSEWGYAIAVDASGNAYVTGITELDFPTTPGAFETSYGGSGDAYVAKFNAAGSALVYSTYLGGSNIDIGAGIAVDSSGNAYVSGGTGSTDFPTTPGAYQTGSGDGFVTKLNAAGSALVYSTYSGSSTIAVDAAGNAYVGEWAVVKLNAAGSALVYSIGLGGYPTGIAVDAAGNAYVTGYAWSSGFLTTPGAFQPNFGGGEHDAFVTKVNANGSELVYSTYLGGSDDDGSSAIAVDAPGNAYVTGYTYSTDFPITPGAFQPNFGGGQYHAFVAKLNATGSELVYSTYLGGSDADGGLGIAVDASGDAYLAGGTESPDFPTTPGAIQPNFVTSLDSFVTELNAVGSDLVYSSNLAGHADGITLDTSANIYVTGTVGPGFPTTPGAFQTSYGGGYDAFVAKMSLGGPIVSLSPPSLTFGAQIVGTSSAPQAETVTNTGGSPLTISAVAITGTNPSDFATSADTCTGATVAPSGNCTVNVTFTPTATGARSGSLTITDNAGNSPQAVALTGVGISGAASVSPASRSFGAQALGTTSAAKTVTLTSTGTTNLYLSSITITGTNTGDFAETDNCPAIMAPGAKCTFSVTFTPSIIGAETGTLTVTDSASNSPQTASLAGTGVLPVTLLPASPSFGKQAENTASAAKTITLTNNLNSALAISSITTSGDFAQTNNCGISVPASSQCTISVTFTPSILGAETGTLTVTDGASNSPQTASLAGTGVLPVTLLPASPGFGTQAENTASAARTITLTNNLDSALAISSITTSGDFAQTNNCSSSVPADSKCTISVTFTPSIIGAETGTLTVTDAASNSPQTASLAGSGVLPVTLLPGSPGFGTQAENTTSAAKTITLTNNLDSALAISTITTSGDFAQTNNCGSSVPANSKCTILVTFTPSVIGAETGTLTVTDTASNSPQPASLAGAGIEQAKVAPASLAFGGVAAGSSSAGKNVTLTNNLSTALAVSITFAGADPGDFAETDTCSGSVAAASSCTITVTFTPTSKGTRSATLNVNDSANNSPQTVSLTGTGK